MPDSSGDASTTQRHPLNRARQFALRGGVDATPMIIVNGKYRVTGGGNYSDRLAIAERLVARERGRPVENRWIGQRIDDPAPDLAMMARAQGLTAFGPVTSARELEQVLTQAIQALKTGASVVVEAIVAPGYAPAMSQGMTRSHGDE